MNAELNNMRFVPDLILLGDGAQYVFLSWLLPESCLEKLQNEPVYVRHSNRFALNKTDSGWVIYTTRVLPHMTVYIPAAGESWLSLVEQTGARCAVFEEHPFGKSSTGEILLELEGIADYPEFLLVLVNLPRHRAPTDIPSANDTPERVIAENLVLGRAAMIVRNREDTIRILHWHEPLPDLKLRTLKKELELLRQRQDELKYEYEYLLEDWQVEDGIMGPGFSDKISKYKTIEKSDQTSIWKCYEKEANKLLFPSNHRGALFEMEEIYKGCIDRKIWKVFPFARDGDILIARMKKALAKRLEEGYIQADKPFPFSAEAYREIVEREEIIGQFQACIQHFMKEDILKLAQDLLGERCQQVERLLAEEVLV